MCVTMIDQQAPYTPIPYLTKNEDGSYDLSESTNVASVETDCCYYDSSVRKMRCPFGMDRRTDKDQSCTFTITKRNKNANAQFHYSFSAEDGTSGLGFFYTGCSGTAKYYYKDYKANGTYCLGTCTTGTTDKCSCNSYSTKKEIYAIDSVGNKSSTLTINYVWN